MGKFNISAASVKLRSLTYVKAVSPMEGVPTCGFACTPEQAISIATQMLAVASDSRDLRDIYVTARSFNKSVTVIRRKGKIVL